MHVQKTVHRHGVTLEHGAFEVIETVHVCPFGCRLPSGAHAARRAEALTARIPPGSVVGYDVMAFVGRQRFVEHRQREEIRAALLGEYGITLSTGEISTLAVRFLGYLERLHAARSAELGAAMSADGGWPLHVDATGENGRGTLFIAYTGWRGWVLGAWKIPTERTDAILPRLRTVTAQFGAPVAMLRDLGRAVTEACDTLAEELGGAIPILACHLHFAKDVGKDLLGESHDQLRALFRQFDVRKQLRTLARDLGRRLGTNIEEARDQLRLWQPGTGAGHALPGGEEGLATVRALAQWVLDFAADGTDEGFPFELPFQDLVKRCRTACRAADAFLRSPPHDDDVHKAVARLRNAVAPVESEVPFQQTARRLAARAEVFTELREALRPGIKPARGPKGQPTPALREEEVAKLRDIQTAVARLDASLRERRPQRGPAQDARRAIDIVIAHLDRHGSTLFGHAIRLPDGTVRLVDRTNNELEGFNHALKHGERRRSGRKILTQDFERLPAAAALAVNLTRADYVEIVCGSIDRLPAAFAQLDAQNRSRATVVRGPPSDASPAYDDIEAASLPTADRRLVRTPAIDLRIRAAAASRPPRPALATAL